MKIQNLDKLSRSDARKNSLLIAEAGLEAIDTRAAIKRSVKLRDDKLVVGDEQYTLTQSRRVFVVGVGKCSLDAAFALEEILGEVIYKGMVIDIRCDTSLKRIKSCEGDHPFPSQRNVDLTGEMLAMLGEVKEDDVVIMVISGGGSTMLCSPVDFTCIEEAHIIESLFRGGATIHEINTVRKHLSLARGGGLAKHAYPASVAALIFSDVVGNDLSFIASGPTVVDNTTVAQAREVIEKYYVAEKTKFNCELLMETPKDEKFFTKVHNTMIVSNDVALSAMKKKAEELGITAKICTSCLMGEASIKGERIIKELHHVGRNSLLLYGGETTVRIRGSGKGGRNQELVLGAVRDVAKDELILSIASDGRDNCEVAGALCDTITKGRAEELHLDPQMFLASNDSFHFFEKLNDHIVCGPTGSNTADFVIALKR